MTGNIQSWWRLGYSPSLSSFVATVPTNTGSSRTHILLLQQGVEWSVWSAGASSQRFVLRDKASTPQQCVMELMECSFEQSLQKRHAEQIPNTRSRGPFVCVYIIYVYIYIFANAGCRIACDYSTIID